MLAQENLSARSLLQAQLGNAKRCGFRVPCKLHRAREIDRLGWSERRSSEFAKSATRVVGLQRDRGQTVTDTGKIIVVLSARQALRHHEQLEIIVAEHDAMILRAQRMMTARGEGEAHASERILGRIQIARRNHHVVYALDMLSHSCSLVLGTRHYNCVGEHCRARHTHGAGDIRSRIRQQEELPTICFWQRAGAEQHEGRDPSI